MIILPPTPFDKLEAEFFQEMYEYEEWEKYSDTWYVNVIVRL